MRKWTMLRAAFAAGMVATCLAPAAAAQAATETNALSHGSCESPAKDVGECATVVCEGTYGGHLQGVATDGESIFWSFTVKLVKTDFGGRVLTAIDVPNHHGDLCVKDGVVYVAVNLGRFNFENLGVSEVRAYAAKDLRPVGTWKLPMCGHGAGGMTWAGDRFYVVGGLPATHERNYVYEFTSDFALVKRHELKTGFTLMGIQTAAFEDDRFIFGIYGCAGDPSGSLECPHDLSSFVRRLGPGNVGIVKLRGAYWTGRIRPGAQGGNGGCLVRSPGYPDAEPVYAPKRTGKGAVRLFFEGCEPSGWQDCGYGLEPNGYRPLCNADPALGVFFAKDGLDDPEKVLPAVGIGGDRAYSAPDLVRAVRRVAKTDEAFALHAVGTPASVGADAKLADALASVRDEAKRLGVRLVVGESVSRTLECAYDDACAARFAEALGKTEDARRFRVRPERWRNLRRCLR